MQLSVLIAAHNAQDTLERCVDSALRQAAPDVEILVVDDGSTDATPELCARLARCGVRTLRQEHRGAAAARNLAMERARGEWMLFLDSDDCLADGALEGVCPPDGADVVLLRYSRKACRAFGTRRAQEADPRELARMVLRGPHGSPAPQDSIANWSCWGKLFRTEVARMHGVRFPEELFLGEDLVFCRRFYRAAQRAVCLDWTAYCYLGASGSVTARFQPGRIGNTRRLFAVLEEDEPGISRSADFAAFAANRAEACCRLQCAARANPEPPEVRALRLRELCESPLCAAGLAACRLPFSGGVRTHLARCAVVALLRRGQYGAAIRLSALLAPVWERRRA